MKTELHWIPLDAPGRLAIVGRPRGNDWLDDEMSGWERRGVSAVVSMLEPDGEADLGSGGEAEACAAHAIVYESVPVADRGVPADEPSFQAAVESAAELLLAGSTVAVHCRQGIGRSGLSAAAVLWC